MAEATVEKRLETAKADLEAMRQRKARLPQERVAAGVSGDAVKFTKLGGDLDAASDGILALEVKVAALEIEQQEARLPILAEQIVEAYGRRQVVEEKLKEITRAFSALDNEWRQLMYEKNTVEAHLRDLKRERDLKVRDVSLPQGPVVRSRWQA